MGTDFTVEKEKATAIERVRVLFLDTKNVDLVSEWQRKKQMNEKVVHVSARNEDHCARSVCCPLLSEYCSLRVLSPSCTSLIVRIGASTSTSH